MVESSGETWSTGDGNGKPLQYSCLENPMNSMKRQKDRKLKDQLPRSVGAQHVTGDQWRNNSRKNEGMEPKQKQYPVVPTRPEEFFFQYPIILSFHTVHGVLKARILKWFAIPFSSGPRFVRTLHHAPSLLGGPTWHGL